MAEGFQRRDFSFAPDTITVSGQEELVSQVDHAQITISQEDMNSTYSADCSYTLIGTNGQPIAAGLVETEPETVLVTLPVEKMKEVELTVDLIPGGGATADNVTVDIEPRTLMVAGSAEILDQLRLASFDPLEFPDAESYLWQLQNNFIRMTDQECHLPEAGLEKQAQVMFAALAKVGALEVLEDG